MKKKTGKWMLEQLIFPAVLFLAPLWNVNSGVDLGDTGYNLCNYAYPDNVDNTWRLATWLSNAAGSAIMRLPGGGTLLGMRVYTALLVSVMAVAAYFFCRRMVPAAAAFAGELLAVCLCWCPTVILYNYLTYFLILFALMLLYEGLRKDRMMFLAGAGVLIGVNLFVRVSNAVQALYIFAVWYAGFEEWRSGKRACAAGGQSPGNGWEIFRKTAAQTGACVAGFLTGFLAGFAAVCVREGPRAYFNMLAGMSEIESGAKNYSVRDMLLRIWTEDYAVAALWLLFLSCYALAGAVLFRLARWKLEPLKKVVFLLGMPFLYRFLWGRAVFDFNYYSYGAMFWPTVMMILLMMAACILRLMGREAGSGEKLMACLALLILLVTPFGTNNKSYPVMNNLFLVLPFAFWWGYRLLRGRSFPLRSTVLVFTLFWAVQAAAFGACFVFGDGSPEEKRDTKIENDGILKGIYTGREKADTMERLYTYYEERGNGRPIYCYGNIPALPYYLSARAAAGSSWPDLPSYSLTQYRLDMERLRGMAEAENKPVVMIGAGVDEEDRKEEKFRLLLEFMEAYGYEERLETPYLYVYD